MNGQFNFGEWRFRLFDDYSMGKQLGRLERNIDANHIELFTPKGEIKTLSNYERCEEADLWRMDDSMFQGIMDGLWKAGYRPQDRRYEEESKLRDAHLQDLRRIVFKDFPA